MQRKITMRHMDHAPDVENYANAALDRVADALDHERSPRYIELVITPGRPHAHHEVELLVKSPNYDLVFKQEGPHVFQLIDRVCDLAYAKIHEEKKKRIQERKNNGVKIR